ncbi:MmyB family transcriptional regulator [Winogradskya consettensis]|uniref:MmyB family transcriptional regulator n=1 Tax=Winogradskya consettensis TaxID=113560 RepID=UPI001BB41731
MAARFAAFGIRAATDVHPDAAELVTLLTSRSPEFAALWQAHDVRACLHEDMSLLHPPIRRGASAWWPTSSLRSRSSSGPCRSWVVSCPRRRRPVTAAVTCASGMSRWRWRRNGCGSIRGW